MNEVNLNDMIEAKTQMAIKFIEDGSPELAAQFLETAARIVREQNGNEEAEGF